MARRLGTQDCLSSVCGPRSRWREEVGEKDLLHLPSSGSFCVQSPHLTLCWKDAEALVSLVMCTTGWPEQVLMTPLRMCPGAEEAAEGKPARGPFPTVHS